MRKSCDTCIVPVKQIVWEWRMEVQYNAYLRGQGA